MDLLREPKTEKTTDASRNLNLKKMEKYLLSRVQKIWLDVGKTVNSHWSIDSSEWRTGKQILVAMKMTAGFAS